MLSNLPRVASELRTWDSNPNGLVKKFMLSNAVLPLIKQNKRAMEEETLKTACDLPLLFNLNGAYTDLDF